jgi:hypothetical protein
MRGWRRLGLALVGCWWAWCAFVIVKAMVELNHISKSWDMDHRIAREMLLSDEPYARQAAHNHFQAHANIHNALISAVILPAILLVVFVVVRWVVKGFEPATPTDDRNQSSEKPK